MTVGLGPQRTVVLVGYEVVKDALVDHADDFLGRGPLPFLMKPTRGYGSVLHLYSRGSIKMSPRLAHVIPLPPFPLSGVAISNGERWRQLRRFTLSTLRDFGMGRKGMEAWIQEESKHLVARMNMTKGPVVAPNSYFCRRWSFKRRCQTAVALFAGAAFDPTFFLSCSVSNVICCLVFGQRFSYNSEQFLSLLRIVSEAIQFGSSACGQVRSEIAPEMSAFKHLEEP